MLSLIVAMDDNHLIGSNNQIPWDFPEDLNLFKSITSNNIVIMGRKTFESIGKPLPNRFNIVLTKKPNFLHEGIHVFNCTNKAIKKASLLQAQFNKKIFIIGGSALYQHFLPFVDELHISHIKGNYIGDTYFPEINLKQFNIVKELKYNGFTYIKYVRKHL
ncbi:dihydrofolate reductase [Cetobacterium sp.]|uniref:dihydrofolate reductase n=1 Tax=Cetobacterium sp. TaxID=2071632 RepID=UPI003F2A2C62